mgnify:FL=1
MQINKKYQKKSPKKQKTSTKHFVTCLYIKTDKWYYYKSKSKERNREIQMAKYRFFQVIMALALVILIISSAVMCSFMVRKVSEGNYKPQKSGKIMSVMNNGQSEELSELDAWVEYSIISDGLDGSGSEDYRAGNIYLSTENEIRLDQLKDIKSKASNGMFISLVILIACFVIIKKRRLYECVAWGGAAGVIIGIISFLMMLFSRNGILYGMKKLIFDGDSTALFPGHDVLADIIPSGLGLKVLCVYLGTIFVGLVVTIIVRVVSYKKSRPHRFR